MEGRRVRISDIAEELGLSSATVSNVIHGKTKKVSDETQRRVQALLEERRYIPSMAGILLSQNSSRIIGVFINDHEKYEGHTLEDAFIASSLNHLSAEIESRGQFMMVKKAKRAEEILRFASMWNMDGLVVIGFCRQDYRYLREHIRIPFVVYDGLCEKTERIVNISLDNFGGGRQAGELFRRLGHRRAICISDNKIGIDRERIDGFQEGFSPGRAELMRVPIRKKERCSAYLLMEERFRSATAVFAVSDYYAIELLFFLKGRGFRIPEDLALAGFDDIPLSEMISPSLTTLRQDAALRAKLALEELLALKEGGIREPEIRIPVHLIERESSGGMREDGQRGFRHFL